MTSYKKIIVTLSALLILPAIAFSEESEIVANDKEATALDRRIEIERATRFQPFVLTPHRPNYILPFAYNDKPNNAAADMLGDGGLKKTEVKFQFSIKFPVADNLFGKKNTLQFAYTNLSFWQAYSGNVSSPFRETVHEPEFFIIFENDWEFLGFKNRIIQLGIVHQSNGRSGAQSRSWDRVYADFTFESGNCYLSFKPWYRVERSRVDDNPDIEKYMGHGEIRGVYAGGKNTLSVMLRNNFHSPNYGAFEINWSFPMSRRAKWFVQYFNGYGESLIDYNAHVNRLGIGVSFTDWL